jgi:hypothetical protein
MASKLRNAQKRYAYPIHDLLSSFHKFQQLPFGAVHGGQFFGPFDTNREVVCQGREKIMQFFLSDAQLIRKESVCLDALEKSFGKLGLPF